MLSRLRERKVSTQTVDVGIAAAVFVATVYPTLRWETTWANTGWAALASFPLIWRRMAPVPVAMVCGAGTTALSIVHALPDMPYGQLVATYTIAELSGLTWRLIAVGITVAGITVSLAVPGEAPDAYGYTGLLFVSAWALGTGVRAGCGGRPGAFAHRARHARRGRTLGEHDGRAGRGRRVDRA
jgi:hypothetical protein